MSNEFLAMTDEDFHRRLSAWMASKDELAMPAFALIESAAKQMLTFEESMDLLAIGFAAGYVRCDRDHKAAKQAADSNQTSAGQVH
jgi:hypothetical protein